MKLFEAIGEFLRTLFVPADAPKKPQKPGAQTHGGFRDGFEKAVGKPVNLTGVTPALIVVPEEVAEPAPQPDNDFVASLDDLALDGLPVEPAQIESAPTAEISAPATPTPDAQLEVAPASVEATAAVPDAAVTDTAPTQATTTAESVSPSPQSDRSPVLLESAVSAAAPDTSPAPELSPLAPEIPEKEHP